MFFAQVTPLDTGPEVLTGVSAIAIVTSLSYTVRSLLSGLTPALTAERVGKLMPLVTLLLSILAVWITSATCAPIKSTVSTTVMVWLSSMGAWSGAKKVTETAGDAIKWNQQRRASKTNGTGDGSTPPQS